MFGRTKKTTDVKTAHDELAAGAAMIDVRTKGEWKDGHVRGATHLSLDSLPNRVDWLQKMLGDGPVYVICRSGNRSGRAAGYLRRLGIDAINVRGGMIAWQRAQLPVATGKK